MHEVCFAPVISVWIQWKVGIIITLVWGYYVCKRHNTSIRLQVQAKVSYRIVEKQLDEQATAVGAVIRKI